MGRKLTQTEFIDKCVSGNPSLDYSETIYKGAGEKVYIKCSKHGGFWIKANDFLRSLKCPNCARNVPTTEEFIEKCKSYYPEYDYSQVVYTNKLGKVLIRCPKHDYTWEVVAQNAAVGKLKCPKCHKEEYQQNNSMSESEFINKANIIHRNKYDYSEMQYINMRTKIHIKCPKHGIFEQLPSNHLSGSGCPKCKRSKGEELIAEYLNNYSIKFQEQFIIPYQDKRILVDFYLPEYNIFIEYNGIQHYIAMDYFGGELRLTQQQNRDQYLREYCKNEGVILIEIKYDQDIISILNEKLTERKNGR